MKTSFAGPPPREGYPTLNHSTISSFPMMVLPFLGRVFGGGRPLENDVLCLVGHPREDPHLE